MSQYINFYIKEKSGRRIPIGSYSRNSIMFSQCRNFVPFEHTSLLDNTKIEQIIQTTEKELTEKQRSINDFENHIKDICNYNNSAAEKDDLILSYRETINDIKDDINEYKYTIGILKTYIDINDALKYSDEKEWEGIEAGVEA